MNINFMFSFYAVFTLFVIKLNTAQKLGEYLVRRTQTYDEIKFDGDCNVLDAASTVRSGTKWCTCEKFLEVNNIKTTLYGSLVISEKSGRQAIMKCVYDYRETGANFFIFPSYSTAFTVITSKDKDVKRYITKGANIFVATQYSSDTRLFVDALLMYDNQKQTYIKYNSGGGNVFAAQQISIPNLDKVNYGLVLVTASIDGLAGSMPQVILNGSNSQGKFYGFTVVKFIGERTYKIYIGMNPTANPSYSSTSPTKSTTTTKAAKSISQNEDNKTYEIITYALVGVACILILVMILLIWRLRRKTKNNKSSLEARISKLNIPQEKQANFNDGSKRYLQLSPSLINENYQQLAGATQVESRPQPPVPSQTKVENRNSVQNEYGYEITYNDKRNSSIYTDAF